MSLTQTSLIEATNFCNEKGYDLFPVKMPQGVRCIVFKNGIKIKEGEKVFNTWLECKKENYLKIYKRLK